RWADKQIPTEAEWEYASRGGLDQAEYAWGEELTPDGRHMANIWQGEFPMHNTVEDGYYCTSPVNAFPRNGFGVRDMIGNVWEWTSDWYAPRHALDPVNPNAILSNPHVTTEWESYDPNQSEVKMPRKVVKGGSHLSAPNFDRSYRPAARLGQPINITTS